ncbi:hypothetical protein Gotri_008087, partial [Gossypium trilobum]|nr:hypothetical protein [Gossypium trilobum]
MSNGLHLAWERGYRRLVIENNNILVVHMLNSDDAAASNCVLVRGIKEFCH